MELEACEQHQEEDAESGCRGENLVVRQSCKDRKGLSKLGDREPEQDASGQLASECWLVQSLGDFAADPCCHKQDQQDVEDLHR